MSNKKIFGLAMLFVLSIFKPVLANEQKWCEVLTQSGMTQIDGKSYLELGVKPEISLGNFGLGLGLILRYNKDDGFRKQDLKDVEDFIRYVRWAEKGKEPIYIRIGELDNAILGNGFILNWYSNRGTDTSFHVLGTEIDLKFKNGGLETVINDITKPRLYGSRIYIKPLEIGRVDLPLLDKTILGLTYVTDTDYNPKTSDKEKLNVYGFDLQLPIIENKISLIYEYGKVKDYGDGSTLGIGGQAKIPLINFNYKIALRNMDANFCPNIFNSLYEVSRPGIESLSAKKVKGWYGESRLSIAEMLNFIFAYQDEEDKNPTLHSELILPTLKNISFSLGYDQNNAKNLFTFTAPDSAIVSKIAYDITEHVTLNYLYEQRLDAKGDKTKETSMLAKVHF